MLGKRPTKKDGPAADLSIDEMITEIGKLERRGQLQEAAAVCKRVLELPDAAEYHKYAQNMLLTMSKGLPLNVAAHAIPVRCPYCATVVLPMANAECPACQRAMDLKGAESISDLTAVELAEKTLERDQAEIDRKRAEAGLGQTELNDATIARGVKLYKAPLRWRMLRVLFILSFLLSGLALVGLVCAFISFEPFEREASALAEVVRGGVAFVSIVLWMIASISLSRYSATKIRTFEAAAQDRLAAGLTSRQQEIVRSIAAPERRFTRELIAVVIGVIISLVNFVGELPAIIAFPAFLVGFFAAPYVVFACKTFRWRNYLIAGLAPGLVCAPIWIPSLMRAREIAYINERTVAFRQTLTDAEVLVTHDDLVQAIQSPKAVAGMPELNESILVLDADSDGDHPSLTVSELDQFMPKSVSAKQPSALNAIVILGKMGAEGFPGSPDASLVAPVIVYRWPQKQLVFTAELSTGCKSSESAREVYPKAADSLLRLLQNPPVPASAQGAN